MSYLDNIFNNIGDDSATLANVLRNRPATPAPYTGNVSRLASLGLLSSPSFNDSIGATGANLLQAIEGMRANRVSPKVTAPTVTNTASTVPEEVTVQETLQTLHPSFYQSIGPYAGSWNPLATYKDIKNVSNPPPAPTETVQVPETTVKTVKARTGDSTIIGSTKPKKSDSGTSKKKAASTTTSTTIETPTTNKPATNNYDWFNALLPLLAAGGIGYLLAK